MSHRASRIRLVTAIGVVTLAACSLVAPARAGGKPAKITLWTEHNPPYQVVVDGKLAGDNVQTVHELFKRAGIPVELKLDTWEKSYEAAQKRPDAGVFTTIRNNDREDKFQWVGPISVARWVFLAKKGRNLKLSKLSEVAGLKIGGYLNDSKSDFLEKQGYIVDRVDEDAKNAKRLAAGQIDLWATGFVSGMKFAQAAGVADQLEQVFVFREDFGYIAMNLKAPKNVVLDLNRIVDEMKSEGRLDRALKFKN